MLCPFSCLTIFCVQHGITHNMQSKVAGVTCATFNLVMFFTAFPLVKYLPRFFLCGLLVFAGIGFLVENLWDSRKKLKKMEISVIWIILIIFVMTEQLIIAVVFGMVWSSTSFAFHYARFERRNFKKCQWLNEISSNIRR